MLIWFSKRWFYCNTSQVLCQISFTAIISESITLLSTLFWTKLIIVFVQSYFFAVYPARLESRHFWEISNSFLCVSWKQEVVWHAVAWENEIKACNMSVIHTTSLKSCDHTDGLYFPGAESCFLRRWLLADKTAKVRDLHLDEITQFKIFKVKPFRLRDFKTVHPFLSLPFPATFTSISGFFFLKHDPIPLSPKPHHPTL